MNSGNQTPFKSATGQKLPDARRLKYTRWGYSTLFVVGTGWASYMLFRWMQPSEKDLEELLAKMDPEKLREVEKTNR